MNKNERINEINENLRLIERTDGLVFGTDAYLLSAFLPKRSTLIGAELGAGTGVISLLALSKNKCKHVYGIEIQEDFSRLSERNAELNGFSDRFTIINKNVNDCTCVDTFKEVDFVFSNPPYMKVSSGKANENDEKNIARHEVCANIYDFCACAKRILKHGGNFYIVYRPDRMIDLISALRNNNFEPKKIIFIHPNSTTPPSLILVSAKLGAKSGLIIPKPVFIYKDGTTEYTEEYENIYKNCSLEL